VFLSWSSLYVLYWSHRSEWIAKINSMFHPKLSRNVSQFSAH
jgi:hypothetical protein